MFVRISLLEFGYKIQFITQKSVTSYFVYQNSMRETRTNTPGTALIQKWLRGMNTCSDVGTLILLSTLSFTRILLDHVDKVDIPDSRGYTPLHIASKASLADNVLLLLKHGANPNAQGNDGATPLHKSREAIQ